MAALGVPMEEATAMATLCGQAMKDRRHATAGIQRDIFLSFYPSHESGFGVVLVTTKGIHKGGCVDNTIRSIQKEDCDSRLHVILFLCLYQKIFSVLPSNRCQSTDVQTLKSRTGNNIHPNNYINIQ